VSDEPGIFGWILAHLHDEVAAEALEAYRRAGSAVYDLRDDLDRVRLEHLVTKVPVWDRPQGARIALICGWNAFVHQLLGDHLLEADYACEPRTVGYVLPETARQALSSYGQVAGWLSRARQALDNPTFELDVAVPAVLPPWVVVKECPEPYLDGLNAALLRVRQHAEGALGDFRKEQGRTDAERRSRNRIAQLAAEAESAADYANGLRGAELPEDESIRQEILTQVRIALERYYVVGQLLGSPALALEPVPSLQRKGRRAGQPALAPLPGDDKFDAWCLTDPRVARTLRGLPQAKRAIDRLWKADPDPTRTLAIKAEIDGALYRDDIAYAHTGQFHTCPWSATYIVKRPLKIAGKELTALQTFTYAIDRSEGHFRRQILVGTFHRTGNMKY
jgi:hypothetical protein